MARVPVTTRTTNLRALVIAANPNWARDSRIVDEYEFSSAPGGDPKQHADGQRVFRGDYQNRGPYSPDD